MGRDRRWDPCIAHRGEEVESFIAELFRRRQRRVLLIAGAGFDPRSTAVASRLARQARPSGRCCFRRTGRGRPQGLVERATSNISALIAAVRPRRDPVEMFGADGAVVGGRNVVGILWRQVFDGISDVIVDTSALSVGTSFPIVRYLVELIGHGKGPPNLHVFVAHDPTPMRRSSLSRAMRQAMFTASKAVQRWTARPRRQSYGSRSSRLGGEARSAASMSSSLLMTRAPSCRFPASDPRLGDKLAEEF